MPAPARQTSHLVQFPTLWDNWVPVPRYNHMRATALASAEERVIVQRIWAMLILVVALPAIAAAAPTPRVAVTTNLVRDGREAAARRLPILLVLAAEHCTYCEMLDREILNPMVLSGDYRDKVLIRKVMLDGDGGLLDFAGRRVTAGTFATQHNVSVTPTMLFVDSQGRELAPRLVGINTVEMFAGLVDAAIDQARSKLRAEPAVAQSKVPATL